MYYINKMGENSEDIPSSPGGKVIPLAPRIEERNKKEAEALFRKLVEAAAERRFKVIKGGAKKKI